MEIDVSKTDVVDVYHFLVGLVTPRPIAWVTTISESGVVNLAPFSFFNTFGANPPVVVFSPTLSRELKKKDTLLNIESNGEFCINASTTSHADLVNLSSKPLRPDESEIELTGLDTLPCEKISVPRLTAVPFSLECKTMQILPIGSGPISANLIIGEVLHMHIDDAFLGEDGLPDPNTIQTIGRLGGDYWCHTTDLFQLDRPQS
jgi:flavin reductase (DIM6/NTAB) family NADH-FMN oxidoreductase RutF